MTTHDDTPDTADGDLRQLLAGIDPEAGSTHAAPVALLDRILAEPPTGRLTRPAPEADHVTTGPGPTRRRSGADPARRPFLRRHWQGGLLVAASVATLALAGGSLLGGVGLGSTTADSSAGGAPASAGREPAAPEAPAAGRDAGADAAGGAVTDSANDLGTTSNGEQSAPSASGTATADDATLVRSGSMLVGTENVPGGRDSFVAAVQGMGGRVLSESVVSEGAQSPVQPMGGATADYAVDSSYPYPWWPSGPGIWLTVQVPAERYEEAMAAARTTGEVVSLQQSSYDVGSQVADVDARIKSLEASLDRLTALMDEANSVNQVLTLEKAIADRQSELDGLRAQQRELANQTAMSQISLTLMAPDDATATVDPEPSQTWWESFLAGLTDAWAWLGRALLIISPLLIALAVIAIVRIGRRGRGGGGGAGPASPETSTTA